MIRLQNINLTSTEAIQRLANNHAIAVNLRDAFPYPYTIEDAITVCYVNFQNYNVSESHILRSLMYSLRVQ